MSARSQDMGERIRLARKAAGLSLRALADQIGISHTMVAKLEKGEAVPASGMLLKLAQALGVKVAWIMRPTRHSLTAIEYRKKSNLPAKERHRVMARVRDHFERRLEVEGLKPESTLQSLAVPDRIPASIKSFEEVERAAELLRDEWELGTNPIPDLIDVCEAHGLRVFTIPDGHESFDGLAAVVGGWPIVVVSADSCGDRQRFTLSHELGHRVLDCRLDGLDPEKAAMRFAAAFLFPKSACIRELGAKRSNLDPRELYLLKHEWGMSMRSLIYRARDLGVIKSSDIRGIEIRMRRTYPGWPKTEPGRPVAPERSHVFDTMVYQAYAEGLIGESKAAELLDVSLDDFRDADLTHVVTPNAECTDQ